MSQSDYLTHKKNRTILKMVDNTANTLDPVMSSQTYSQLKNYVTEHDLMKNNTKITYNRLPNSTKIHFRNMEVRKPTNASICVACGKTGSLGKYVANRNIQLKQKGTVYQVNTLNYHKNKLKEYSINPQNSPCENITQEMIEHYVEREFCQCDTFLARRKNLWDDTP